MFGTCATYFAQSGELGGQRISPFFVVLAVVAFFGLVILVRRLGWRLRVFENGFVLLRGKAALTILWDEIKYLREASWDLTGVDMRVETHAGQRVQLDSTFRNSSSLAQSIRVPANASLFGRAETQLTHNSPIEFDSLSLLVSGLAKGGEQILWDDVDRITLKHTGKCYKFVIHKSGKGRSWYERSAPYFPNLRVFLALVRRYAPTKLELPPEASELA